MVFVRRQLDRIPTTLAEKLRALRRGQAISLDTMESKTHIQRRYLVALEEGDYASLPEPLYARNFIRAYTRLLNADESYFIELYEEECGKCDLVNHMRTPRQKVRKSKFYIFNKFIKFGLLGIVILLVVVYLGFQLNKIISVPEVVVFSPVDSIIVTSPSVQVEGLIQEEATVYVNDKQVVVGDDRIFRENVDLEKGLNTITIEAERRYSKRSHIERNIVFDPQVD